jgi:hypothetical protein
MQISMNLEDVERQSPLAVFKVLEEQVRAAGGKVRSTEIIGMIPDRLLLGAAADRLGLLDPDPARVLSSRLAEHLGERERVAVRDLLKSVDASADDVPPAIRAAMDRLVETLGGDVHRDGGS